MSEQVQDLPWEIDYQAEEGVIGGKVLLEMVYEATLAALPELFGKAKRGLVDRRNPAVDLHVGQWGVLIAEKRRSAHSAAQEPTAPLMEQKQSGFSVNYAYWLSGGTYDAWSYQKIAAETKKAGLRARDVRAWLRGLKQGGSELTKLVGEATFGAEVARNPRVFASHLMAYDLLDNDGVPVESPQEYAKTLPELYDRPHNYLEAQGALPMMGQETYARGLEGVSTGCPNRVHRKEAIVICAWLRRLQGQSKAFTRDQIYELLLQRISSFDDLSSILVPTAGVAAGRGQAIRTAIANAKAADDNVAQTKQQEQDLLLAKDYVTTQLAQLTRLRKQRQAEQNPQRIKLLDVAIAQQETTLEQAEKDLARLTGGGQTVPPPTTVPPPVTVTPTPVPVVVTTTPPADVTMTNQDRKQKREDEDDSDDSNKKQKTEV